MHNEDTHSSHTESSDMSKGYLRILTSNNVIHSQTGDIFSSYEDKSTDNDLQCCICGSKRQRNLITKKHLFLQSGTITSEVRCKRCWNAFELLGDGTNRIHHEGSLNSSKKAYRYFNRAQADRAGVGVK